MDQRRKAPVTRRQRAAVLAVTALFLLAALAACWQLVKEKPVAAREEPPAEAPAREPADAGEPADARAEDPPPPVEEIDHWTRREDCFVFLLAASDQSSGNADAIMAVRYDAAARTVGVVSIPRDTLIDPASIPARYPKINAAYHGGVDCLKETVSQLLGVPIDYYFTVETEGFVALVDAVGGVDFDIPVHMSYDDPHQGLSIHFEPGMRHLDGQEALAVCRLRTNQDGTVAYPDYDIGRTRTQQAMLKTVAAKALSQPLKLSTYVDIFLEHCDTDLSAGNLLWLAESAIGMDLEEDVSTATLPGDGEVTYGGVSYCYGLYEEEVLALVNDLLNPYVEERTADDLNIFSAE